MIATLEAPTERVLRLCTFAEQKVVRALSEQVTAERDSLIVASHIAAAGEFTHATVNSTLRLLEAAGVIATQSLGTKGIMIRVLDRAAWQSITLKL